MATSWNEGACALLGWREAEMLGQPADRRPREERRLTLLHGSAGGERWHLCKDGQRFWAGGEMTPLKDEAGQVQGFVKILRDRTELERLNIERDNAVRELGQLNDNLKARVVEQAADRTGSGTCPPT
ncbi:PAS domain S-box protein [Paracidovorax cattleyae]|nr:PAS domain S-box protein [Paracidovorax cattleyae]